jgi:hypothetical protein
VAHGNEIIPMATGCYILHLAQCKQVRKGGGFCSVRFCAINFLFDDFWGILLALLVTLKDL